MPRLDPWENCKLAKNVLINPFPHHFPFANKYSLILYSLQKESDSLIDTNVYYQLSITPHMALTF